MAQFNGSSDSNTSWNYNVTADNNTAWNLQDFFFVSLNLFPLIKTICIFCYSITFIVGIMGNCLVIWIAGFKIKTVSALWFLNLASADLLCCAFLPVRITEWALFTLHSYPNELCLISSVVLVFSMCSSVYFLTVISVDRCVSVVWPIWTRIHRTLNMARAIAVIIWVLCLILSAPIAIFYLFIDFSDCAPKNSQIFLTTYFHFIKILRIARFTLMFVLPFAIIVISYSLMFYKINTLMKKRSFRAYQMVIAIVICFFLCWFPYFTWPFIHIGSDNYQLDNLINEICICLAYFNSCINPVLYVIYSQDFKDNFFKSIPSRLEKAFSEKCEVQNGEEDIGIDTGKIHLTSISQTVS